MAKNKTKETLVNVNHFIESYVDDVAKRNDLKIFEQKIRNQESLNKTNLDNLVFFQYLIGNLDWSVPNRHNMKIVKAKDK
jgi:tellurite resistance protein